MLKFNSRNPRLELNPKAGMIIQLNATEPLQVQPSVFTGSTWPASNEAELTLSGIQVGPPNEILGEAAYTVCDIQSKECRKTKSPVSLIFEGP